MIYVADAKLHNGTSAAGRDETFIVLERNHHGHIKIHTSVGWPQEAETDFDFFLCLMSPVSKTGTMIRLGY